MSGGYNYAEEQAASERITIRYSASDVTTCTVQNDNGPGKHNKNDALQKQSTVCTDSTYRYFTDISKCTKAKQSTVVTLHIRRTEPEV